MLILLIICFILDSKEDDPVGDKTSSKGEKMSENAVDTNEEGNGKESAISELNLYFIGLFQ